MFYFTDGHSPISAHHLVLPFISSFCFKFLIKKKKTSVKTFKTIFQCTEKNRLQKTIVVLNKIKDKKKPVFFCIFPCRLSGAEIRTEVGPRTDHFFGNRVVIPGGCYIYVHKTLKCCYQFFFSRSLVSKQI